MSQVKLPTKLRILGVDVQVRRQDLNTEKDADMVVFGHYLANKEIIAIDKSLGDKVAVPTLLHEVLEAINHRCELGLEHHQIMTLESTLVQVMADNKQLPKLFGVL